MVIEILHGIPFYDTADLPIVHLAVAFNFLALQCLLQFTSKNMRLISQQENKVMNKSVFQELARLFLNTRNFSHWLNKSLHLNSPNIGKYTANTIKLLKGFIKICDILIARGLDIKHARDCLVIKLIQYSPNEEGYEIQSSHELHDFLEETNSSSIKYETPDDCVSTPVNDLLKEYCTSKVDRQNQLVLILSKIESDLGILDNISFVRLVKRCPLSVNFVYGVLKSVQKRAMLCECLKESHLIIIDHFISFLKTADNVESVAQVMFSILKEHNDQKRITVISNVLFQSGLTRKDIGCLLVLLTFELFIAKTESPGTLAVKAGKALRLLVENSRVDDAARILLHVLPVLNECSAGFLGELVTQKPNNKMHLLEIYISSFQQPSLIYAASRCLLNPIFSTQFDDCVTSTLLKTVLLVKIFDHIEKYESTSDRSVIARNLMTMITIADKDYLGYVHYSYYNTNGIADLIPFEDITSNPILNCGLAMKKIINFGWNSQLLFDSLEQTKEWICIVKECVPFEIDIFKHFLRYLRYIDLPTTIIDLLESFEKTAVELKPSDKVILQLEYCYAMSSCIKNQDTSWEYLHLAESLTKLNALFKSQKVTVLSLILEFNLLQLDYLVSTNQVNLATEKFDKVLKILKTRSEFNLGGGNISLAAKFSNLLLIARFHVISARLNASLGNHFLAFTRVKIAIKILYSITKKTNSLIASGTYNELKWSTAETIFSLYNLIMSILQRLGITREFIYYLNEFKKMTEALDNPIIATKGYYHCIVYYAFLGDMQSMRQQLEQVKKYEFCPVVRSNTPLMKLKESVNLLFTADNYHSDDLSFTPNDHIFRFYVDLDTSSLSHRHDDSLPFQPIKIRSELRQVSSTLHKLPFLLNLKDTIKVLPTIVSETQQSEHSNKVVTRGVPSLCMPMIEQLSRCNQALIAFASTNDFRKLTMYEMRDFNSVLNHCLSLLASMTIFRLDSNLLADLFYLQDYVNTLPFKNDRQLNHSSSGMDDLLPDTIDTFCAENTLQSEVSSLSTNFHLELNLLLPEKWVLLSLDVCPSTGDLVMSKFARGSNPYFVRLPLNRKKGSKSFEEISNAFKEIIRESNHSTKSAVTSKIVTKQDRKLWWKVRFNLDQQMQDILDHVEQFWFGGFKSLFNHYKTSDFLFTNFKNDLMKLIDNALPSRKARHTLTFDDNVIQCFYNMSSYGREEVDDLIYYIVDQLAFHGEANAYDDVNFDKLHKSIELLCGKYYSLRENMFEHLVLMPSARCSFFPWELLSALRHKSVSRMPSVQMLIDLLKTRLNPIPAERVFYMINPGGDLKRTEEKFKGYFQLQSKWNGLVGKKPENETRLLDNIMKSNLFVYLGHGGCDQYIKTAALYKKCLPSGPVLPPSLLIGCSLGSLQANGILEPSGNIYNWLTCGSPMVLANLWDVTDKDIDLFTQQTLQDWGLSGRKSSQKTLCEAVLNARDSCNLKFLNGAAPIVYGIPLVLK